MPIFSARSLRALAGVHPSLVAVARLALARCPVDFTVTEGLRDMATQRRYVAEGVSQTLASRHLLQPDGFGHAVDLYPFFDGSVQISASEDHYRKIAAAMRDAAETLGVRLTWGGSWKTFKDLPHFQYEGEC